MLIDESFVNSFISNTLYNNIEIKFIESGLKEITDSNIILDSFELKEELMDKEFIFGGCIASEIQIDLINYDCSNLVGRLIKVSVVTSYLNQKQLFPSDNLLPSNGLVLPKPVLTEKTPIFYGKIQSVKRNNQNRNISTIIAYDAFYDMSKTDVTIWFAGSQVGFGFAYHQMNSNFAVLHSSLNEIIKEELGYIYGSYHGSIINDSSSVDINDVSMHFQQDNVNKISNNKKITLIDLLKAYCELKLCFAKINSKTGRVDFITLSQDEPTVIVNSYKDLAFEEFIVEPFHMFEAKYNDNNTYNLGIDAEHSWYNQDNFLMRCRTEVNDIASKYNSAGLFSDIYRYRPFEINLFNFWWFEIGDKIKIQTQYNDIQTITSFVFSKRMKGFQTTLKSDGEQFLGNKTKQNDAEAGEN